MPQPNFDQLLYLAGVLGADAAWLLRGSEAAELSYVTFENEEAAIVIHDRAPASHPIILVARLPDDDGDWGLTELKLPPLADREIQVAALLSATLDALTRMGPGPTLRVLEWVFARYGIKQAPWEARDRRPAVGETTRLAAPADETPKKRPGRPRKEANEP